MKRTLLIIIALFCTAAVYAQIPGNQQRNNATPPPLPSRQVSGIVKDSTDSTVPGAVVKLVSTHDTLSTSTNADGIFIFKTVKMNVFTITVTSLGNAPYIKKYQMNDAVPRLTLDPVILKNESKMLTTVVINGTPTITYKPDTMQYRATDYKVRANATLDELLKKMEGMEVGSDGSLTHQGQAVTKVKLNGKDYAGGDVAQAIQNLPADIIEYAQVIDDYGDQAARTGIKTGDPTKTLNVTTKADRSVGTTARLIGQGGNYDQYNASIFAQRINANQQLGLIGNFRNAITGIQSTAARGMNSNAGNPGTTKSLQPLSLNYRDQYSAKVQVVSSATYNFNDNTSTSQSYGTRYNNYGNNIFSSSGDSKVNRNGRSANFELDYQMDSLNYLQVTPSYNYSTTENYRNSRSDNVNDYTQTGHGFEHQTVTGTTTSNTPNTTYGMIVLFNHRFKKPRRNFSFQASFNHTDSESNGETQSVTNNYADATTNNLLLSQTAHLLTYKTNNTDSYRGSMTYSEPLSALSQLEFNGQIQRNAHDTKNTTDSLLVGGGIKATNLNFNYVTTETNLNFNYRYNGSKVNLSLGTTLKPYSIQGTKFDNNVGADAHSSLYNFRILPLFRFAYSWSRTQRFTVNYNGSNVEPAFDEIQPFTDKTDPNNYYVGNPNLRAGLTNNITATYNNYFPNSRFNLSFNGNAVLYTDQVASNTTQIFVPIPGSTQQRTIRQISYVNITGSKSYGGNYNISKQLADRRYNIAINGGINYGYSLNMNDNQLYHQTSWNFNERFGPRINPSDNVEINPFFGTSLTKTFSTATNSPSSKAVNNAFGLDGRFYFLKTFQVHYDASKNFTTQTSSVTGIPALNNSPLLINGGFQKEFGQKRAFTLTFDVNDILHQANPITQTVTATGITNTVTSTKSRYFLVGFRLNLQKWSGRPTRNGKTMQRRGDGSFIYN